MIKNHNKWNEGEDMSDVGSVNGKTFSNKNSKYLSDGNYDVAP